MAKRLRVADAPDAPEWEALVSDPPSPGITAAERVTLVAAACIVVRSASVGETPLRSSDRGPDQTGPRSSTQKPPPDRAERRSEDGTTPGETATVAPTERTYVVGDGDFLADITLNHCVTMERTRCSSTDGPTASTTLSSPTTSCDSPGGSECDPRRGCDRPADVPHVVSDTFVDEPYAAAAPNLAMYGEELRGLPLPTEITQAYLGIRGVTTVP